jgi:hypothetical protein
MIFRKRRFRVLLVTLICDEDLLVGSHKGRKLSKLKKRTSKRNAAIFAVQQHWNMLSLIYSNDGPII